MAKKAKTDQGIISLKRYKHAPELFTGVNSLVFQQGPIKPFGKIER